MVGRKRKTKTKTKTKTKPKTKAKAKTLLGDFIKQKIDQHCEPQRKGTPKGEQIGLSDKKFVAVLNLLYNNKLKDIAADSSVSFGRTSSA